MNFILCSPNMLFFSSGEILSALWRADTHLGHTKVCLEFVVSVFSARFERAGPPWRVGERRALDFSVGVVRRRESVASWGLGEMWVLMGCVAEIRQKARLSVEITTLSSVVLWEGWRSWVTVLKLAWEGRGRWGFGPTELFGRSS